MHYNKIKSVNYFFRRVLVLTASASVLTKEKGIATQGDVIKFPDLRCFCLLLQFLVNCDYPKDKRISCSDQWKHCNGLAYREVAFLLKAYMPFQK